MTILATTIVENKRKEKKHPCPPGFLMLATIIPMLVALLSRCCCYCSIVRIQPSYGLVPRNTMASLLLQQEDRHQRRQRLIKHTAMSFLTVSSCSLSSLSSLSTQTLPQQLFDISAANSGFTNHRNNPWRQWQKVQRQRLRLLASVTGMVYIDDDHPQSPMVTLYTKEGT
jgi:hypothetical protein